MQSQTDLPVGGLLQMMQYGVNARSVWDDVFEALRFRTVLTSTQKRAFKKVFRMMAESPMQTQAFLKSLEASMLARPRVTRRFLVQVLPVEWFPRSLHTHAGWRDVAFILDYLRYLLLGVPSKRFEQQLRMYAQLDPIVETTTKTSPLYRGTATSW